jgi:hypothetical protein
VTVPQVKYAFPRNFEVDSLGERGGDTMNKKDVIVTVLATFCLTVTLFSLAPVRSNLPYDPWSDIDENGKIDMKDIANVASQFSTSGDPARNVMIAGHANYLAYNVSTVVSATSFHASEWISVGGYSKISICLHTTASSNSYVLQAKHIGGPIFYVESLQDVGTDYVWTYDVPNQLVRVYFVNNDLVSRNLNLDVYLIP